MSRSIHTLLVTLIAVNVAVYAAYIAGLYWLQHTEAQVRELAAETQELAVKKEQVREMRRAVASSRSALNKLDTFFLTDDTVVPFVETVERLADEAGVSIDPPALETSETAAKGESGLPTETLRLRVQATGTWREVHHYFTLLENLPYQIEMRRARFARQVDEPEDGGAARVYWSGNFELEVLKLLTEEQNGD